MSDLCTVTFPEHLRVLSRRGKDAEGKKTGGEPMEPPVVWQDVPLKKALKLARMSDATVEDADGNVIAKPRVNKTDTRTESASKIAEASAARIAELEATVAKLSADMATKASKPGPKKK